MSRPDPIVTRHLDLAHAARRALPDDPAPFAGTMRVHRAGRVRDILLGDTAHIASGLVRIDHTSAPLAEVFHGVEPGDDYAIDVGDRTLEGTLVDRSLVRFASGRLVELVTDGVRHRLVGDAWLTTPEPGPAPFDGPRRAGRFVEPDQLDPTQRAAVEAPPGPALIVGEAGSGKTTVALHRLVRLARARGRNARVAVIVPTPALARFAGRQLDRLGRPDVTVATFDEWVWRRARRAFRDWPTQVSRDMTPATDDLKRHPRLLSEIADLAASLPERPVRRADLIHLFGDSIRMARAAEGLPSGTAAAVLAHAQVQFADPTEVAMRHVDPEQLATLDARLIDDGTPMQDAGTADPADAAVAFELDRLVAERIGRSPPRVRKYDVLMIDEAQALTPIELRLLGRAVANGGSLIVSGDGGQHMGADGSFTGWASTLAALGVPDAPRWHLPTVYRSPPDLAAWARRWVEPGPPVPVPASVACHRAWHACDLHRWMFDVIERWSVGSLAVIARGVGEARRWARLLDRVVPVRFDPDGAPPDGGGVAVLAVAHARGLEFDGVIVPDADARWSTAGADRRALYVAATRAACRLMLGTIGAFGPLLADVEAITP